MSVSQGLLVMNKLFWFR